VFVPSRFENSSAALVLGATRPRSRYLRHEVAAKMFIAISVLWLFSDQNSPSVPESTRLQLSGAQRVPCDVQRTPKCSCRPRSCKMIVSPRAAAAFKYCSSSAARCPDHRDTPQEAARLRNGKSGLVRSVGTKPTSSNSTLESATLLLLSGRRSTSR